VTCTKELTVRYDGSVVDLKQKLDVTFNGQALGLKELPVTVGKVRVKPASASSVMGKRNSVELTQ
jgi:hypothetical protein